jgi:hypothetical protein
MKQQTSLYEQDDTAGFDEEMEDVILEEDVEEAEDGLTTLKTLRGCIWQDAATVQRQAGMDSEEETMSAVANDNYRQLDFSDTRSARRGFLEDG